MTAADISRLRNVLQKELDRGCDDRLVIGGLDRMLIQMAEDGALSETPVLKQQLIALGSAGYRSLGTPARKEWLARAIAGLPEALPSPALKAGPGSRRSSGPQPDDPLASLPGAGRRSAPWTRGRRSAGTADPG